LHIGTDSTVRKSIGPFRILTLLNQPKPPATAPKPHFAPGIGNLKTKTGKSARLA
jgi:hypothetical protein